MLYPELADLMPNTPNYKGRFLQGIDTNTKVGDKIEAGIPNITGTLPNIWSYMHGGTGAFGAYNIIASNLAGSHDPAVEGIETIFIDASRCSPVYKNGLDTVQPPSVIVKYIIKAE